MILSIKEDSLIGSKNLFHFDEMFLLSRLAKLHSK